ncbi:MAG: enoyl-CoA hydratase [Ignavibacteria bacterium]|nr:enoyl-CoA hydratase [Ignavibacteria bacterium]
MEKVKYNHIILQEYQNPESLNILIIIINRPEVRNALNIKLMEELTEVLETYDRKDNFGCFIITGDKKSFAAGADIKEFSDIGVVELYTRNQLAVWDRIKKIRKPIIAAVSGFALGGGCELAMMCDIIISSKSAVFGQPEINLGMIPGAGATQRLARVIGKSKTMEMILTAKTFTAEEMYQVGLVSKVTGEDDYLDKSIEIAGEICSKPPLAVQLAKESVNLAYETHLETGILLERRNFYLLFDSDDKKEGIKAFMEKRKPKWSGK